MTLEQQLYLGDRAKELLENEAFVKAFEDIEKELIEAWKTSPQRDVDGRERLHLALTMLSKVKSCLTATLAGGKLAMAELEHKKTLAERVKSAMWQ